MYIPPTSLLISLILFGLSAAVVWFSGARLAYLADTLADRFKLAKSLVGLLLLGLWLMGLWLTGLWHFLWLMGLWLVGLWLTGRRVMVKIRAEAFTFDFGVPLPGPATS